MLEAADRIDAMIPGRTAEAVDSSPHGHAGGAADTTLAGCVKWFDAARGYGFLVATDGGTDILLHYNVLARHGRKTLPEGTRVVALVRDGPRGRQALDLIEIDLSAAASPSGAGSGRVDPRQFLDAAGPFQPVTVRWFNRLRGYGFLLAADGTTEIFIHMETVRRGALDALNPGQMLLARCHDGPRGALAVEIAAAGPDGTEPDGAPA